MDETDMEIVRAHSRRMYRQGGRGVSRRLGALAGIVCGVLPMAFVLPLSMSASLESPHLQFAPFSPIVLDIGIPLSIILAAAFSRRWVAAADRRYPVVVAAIIAAVLRLAIFSTAVIDNFGRAQVRWWVWHLIETIMLLIAFIVAMSVAAWPPSSAKNRSVSGEIAGPEGHVPEPGDRVADYKQSTSSERNWRRPPSGQPA